MESIDRRIKYEPAGPTLKRFHESEAFVRGIKGPIGSGKSTGCVVELLSRSELQVPYVDGRSYTRWAIIRNSYPELKTTTLKTWGEWVPTNFGKITFDSPIVHHIINDKIDMEVFFLALDRPEDQRKLLSLELTGAWINEAREVPRAILDALTGRVGRFPSMAKGGATWSGILMDTNAPDDQSYWYKFAEEDRPKGYEFFDQPPGDGPDAENLQNLPPGYYDRIKAGKDEDWIKVYVRGEYGYVTEGKPVFPMFKDSTHTYPTPLNPVARVPLLIGVDFGLTPAAIIAQKLTNGRWLILDEFIATECGITRFGEALKSYMATTYPDHNVDGCWGDPAGNTRDNDEKTALQIMKNKTGWPCRAAPTNVIALRTEVVIQALNRLIDGTPGFVLSPKCKMLRKGLAGGYHYKPIQSSNGTQFHDTPSKNSYSHPCDGLQYLLLGGGEHTVVMRRPRQGQSRRQTVARDSNYAVI